MLGKKSLAIALMGLGLAGSCYADGAAITNITNSVTVTFQATVTAATCPFTVALEGGGSVTAPTNGSILVGNYTINDEPTEKTLTFSMNCTNNAAVPFNKVQITSDAANGTVNTKVGGQSASGQFQFYNDPDTEDGQLWNGNVPIEMTPTKLTSKKKVLFVMNASGDKITTGTHEAPVVFTATYQ